MTWDGAASHSLPHRALASVWVPCMSSPTDEPPISIVMPVFNALPYLDEAVESILAQSWSDFDFVIYDDATTDGSSERL